MLKVKDNVDLKELEKYGFKPNANDDNYSGYYKMINSSDYIFILDSLFRDNKISIEIQKIETYIGDAGTDDEYIGAVPIYLCSELDTLYDLIKADLIEKVDE